MSGSLLRLVCTAAVAAQAVLAPAPAPAPVAVASTAPQPPRTVAELLTDLQRLYRQAEQATETYDTAEEKLKTQRAEVDRLEGELARARRSLHDSQGDVGRLARQQYQGSTGISPYLRLLLARDPQHALDEGHVIGQLARERVRTVGRLAGSEQRIDRLAHQSRKALDAQLTLAEQKKKARDDVRGKLAEVEKLLASLTAQQLAALAEFEQDGIAGAQHGFVASGALGGERAPSPEGDRAVRYAVGQLGKPYQPGARGPASYDSPGLTSSAWQQAGAPIPRTTRQQWTQLQHIPLGELRPGDLVVYFPEATHVALYLGDGMVVQALRPGDRIMVSPIATYPVLGAVRPDPKGSPLTHYTPPEVTYPGARG
ncbi:NlpC/P60 family protein [Streptomyces sp. NPDC020298]|uniref:C40 family peptidase n=1 Tax=unclassified Streptomyces TaxID=2593676 RepID=UPI0033FF6B42